MKNSIPLRVDPTFWSWAKEMVERDPSLNQRKVTKNLAAKKLIIGEMMFNPEFEEIVNKEYRRICKDNEELYEQLQKGFSL